MTLAKRQFVEEVRLKRMSEVKIRSSPLQARLSVIEVWTETDRVEVGFRAVIGKDFAERITRLEIKSLAEAPPYINAPAMVYRSREVP